MFVLVVLRSCRLLGRKSKTKQQLAKTKKMTSEIPPYVQVALEQAAIKYSNSRATTNAGSVLRFIARFVPVTTIVKLFAHKLS